ncbi:MAG: winged helix-turn-helix transcriptional regulator [Candidatus Woesearchaeota archaeon]|nr:winged helix-turn-helix transcriptional regulator [Candidatus Woesearchaeota archaeon]
MGKITEKDRKILLELSNNCRIPATQLGKKVGVSREVADYRVKRLVKLGVIKDFIAEINLDALGYTKTVVYLELKRITKKREEEINDYLTKHPFTTWIATSAGKWSLIFDIHARDTKQLITIINELKHFLAENLGEYRLVTLEDHEHFLSKYFNGTTSPTTYTQKKLDADDRELLKLLAKNGRMEYVAISTILKKTPEAISKRVKNLLQHGIIKRFHIFPDLKKLGYNIYNVQVKLEDTKQDMEIRFLQNLRDHPKVCFYYKPVSGQWTIEFGVFVKHPGEFKMFMQELRNHFPDHVRVHDVVVFYEEIKGNYLPEGVFQ